MSYDLTTREIVFQSNKTASNKGFAIVGLKVKAQYFYYY